MTDPARHDRAVDLHPAAPVGSFSLAMQREMIAIFGDARTWASSAGPGRPLLDRQRRHGRPRTTVSQARQLIFGRTCSTRAWEVVRAHIPGPCAHRRRSGRTSLRRRSAADAGRFVHDRLRAADDRAEACGRMASSTAGEEEALAVGSFGSRLSLGVALLDVAEQ